MPFVIFVGLWGKGSLLAVYSANHLDLVNDYVIFIVKLI